MNRGNRWMDVVFANWEEKVVGVFTMYTGLAMFLLVWAVFSNKTTTQAAVSIFQMLALPAAFSFAMSVWLRERRNEKREAERITVVFDYLGTEIACPFLLRRTNCSSPVVLAVLLEAALQVPALSRWVLRALPEEDFKLLSEESARSKRLLISFKEPGQLQAVKDAIASM